jgi:hypothetical protein
MTRRTVRENRFIRSFSCFEKSFALAASLKSMLTSSNPKFSDEGGLRKLELLSEVFPYIHVVA